MRVLRRTRSRRGDHEDGFTIVETMVSLGVIFTVLVGLLASLNTGVRGLLTGRQRSGGVAVAKEVVEEARGADYDTLGHDLAGDATLAADPAVTGTAPNYSYQPEGVASPESLVGAVDPTYPEHEWTVSLDGATFTVRAYVTRVSPSQGDEHKRLTLVVSWDNEQYGDAVANELKVSTLVSRFGVATAAEVEGVVDVDTGAVTVTGTLAGINLDTASLFFPLVHADGSGDLVTDAHGFSSSSRLELSLGSGTVTGCGTTGQSVTCDGAKAETVADNDGGTAPPLQDAQGPTSYAAQTLSAGTPLSLSLGATDGITSKSSAQSCTLCSPSVGDGDGLLYADDVGKGPASLSAQFDSGLVGGDLVDVVSAGSSTATIDADAVASDQKVVSTGRLVVPAVELVGLSPVPTGFTSAVQVSAVDVTATAQAGPTAALPSVSGGTVNVTVYDTGLLGVPGYRTITLTPGVALADSAAVTFSVGGGLLPTADVTLTTTVSAGATSTDSSSSGGTITDAEANLANWLVVTVHVVIVEAGLTVADLTVEADYGRILAEAEYEAA